ncbi:unnamed protein product [Orchesella dallaii]|uniref:Uncharacterized protein n=1 Tax=Orchesella dallaii TaxID=48710 RepID=A0ABP1RCC2_9HEXA
MEIILMIAIGLSATATAHNFEDLCDTSSVIIQNQDPKACVCFPPGSYEMKECDSSNVEHLKVNRGRECVEIPYKRVAISKALNIPVKLTRTLKQCNEIVSRGKRQAPPAPAAAPAPATAPGPATPYDPKAFFDSLPEDDEDKQSIGNEIGNSLMISQINGYLERVIEKLTGINEEDSGGASSRSKLPAIRILNYAKQIMVKTCTVVSADFFDMAFSAFANLQLDHFQVKEPFISFSSLKRIEQALQQCLQAARPHLFYDNVTAYINNTEECYNHLPYESSNYTILYPGTDKEQNFSISIPDYASSTLNATAIAEPLIESVWKMLVNAHSYCFKYFQGSFNDHHVFTVALLPMFTNKIQEIWLNGVSYDDTKTEHEKDILYGGLFGDVARVKRIIADVDICVGATRAISEYPWFINRPMRDPANSWRRKRSVNNADVHMQTIEHKLQFQCAPQYVDACSATQ